jgi:hypothetical protein
MKHTHYFFGYLFVRFSKLLALLSLILMIALVIYLWVDYGLQANKLSYHTNHTLDLQCRQLEENLTFAKVEVSRVGFVDDLPELKLPKSPRNSIGFVELLASLQAAQTRQAALKDRLTASFSDRAELLQKKIEETVEAIEASRASTRKSKSPKNSLTTSTPTGDVTNLATKSKKTVFRDLDDRRIERMHESLIQARDFLEKLAADAEKKENKELIKNANSALAELINWLPRKENYRTLNQADQSRNQLQSDVTIPPADPLTTALENYSNLGLVIADINSEFHRDWQLDSILFETSKLVDEEAEKCRNAESGLKILRLSCVRDSFRMLIVGMISAFLVLVFADFMQSFFDTASNSSIIRQLLENGRNNEI